MYFGETRPSQKESVLLSDMARPRMNIDIADPDVLNAVKTTPRVLSVPDAGGAAEVGVFNSLGKRRSHLVR